MRFVFFVTKKKFLRNRYAISYMEAFLNFFIIGLLHIQGNPVMQYIIYDMYHVFLFIVFDICKRLIRNASLLTDFLL